MTPDDWNRIEALLRENRSPEQVSLWLAKEGLCRVSHEWGRRIYQYRRPATVECCYPGDWELDTVIGKGTRACWCPCTSGSCA